MNYANAFNCKKCPKRNDEDGCPFWWNLPVSNIQTGEIKMIQQCGISYMPQLFIQTISSSVSTAAALESFRNEGVKAVEKLNALQQRSLPFDGGSD